MGWGILELLCSLKFSRCLGDSQILFGFMGWCYVCVYCVCVTGSQLCSSGWSGACFVVPAGREFIEIHLFLEC